jgi:hypothetical protein
MALGDHLLRAVHPGGHIEQRFDLPSDQERKEESGYNGKQQAAEQDSPEFFLVQRM